MQVSAVIRLSGRKDARMGPRQTTRLGSISNRNVEDGILSRKPVFAPVGISGISQPQISTPDGNGGNSFSSVRYPKTHLISPNFAAENLPTRKTPGGPLRWRAYE